MYVCILYLPTGLCWLLIFAVKSRELNCDLLFVGDAGPHLYGRTRYGCNVQDEWYVVHLLQQLSNARSDLVIR